MLRGAARLNRVKSRPARGQGKIAGGLEIRQRSDLPEIERKKDQRVDVAPAFQRPLMDELELQSRMSDVKFAELLKWKCVVEKELIGNLALKKC